MKTVASLIASSTIGIAATGLTIEKLQPTSPRKKNSIDATFQLRELLHSPSPQRPSSVSSFWNGVIDYDYTHIFPHEIQAAIQTPKFRRRPPLTHENKNEPRPSNRRPVSTCNTEPCIPNNFQEDEEKKRNSVSSRGSLMRCLSSISSYRITREQTISGHPSSQEALFRFWHPSNSTTNASPKTSTRNRLSKLEPKSKECRNRLAKLNPLTSEDRSRMIKMSSQTRESLVDVNDLACPRAKSFISRKSFKIPHYTQFSMCEIQKHKKNEKEATKTSDSSNKGSSQSHGTWNILLDPPWSKNHRNHNPGMKFDDNIQNQSEFSYHTSSRKGSMKASPVNPIMFEGPNNQLLSLEEMPRLDTNIKNTGEEIDVSETSFIFVSSESKIETVNRLHRSISMKLNPSIADLEKITGLRQGVREWTRNHSAPVLLLASSQPLGGICDREMKGKYCTALNYHSKLLGDSPIIKEEQNSRNPCSECLIYNQNNSPLIPTQNLSFSKGLLRADITSTSFASLENPPKSSLTSSKMPLTTTIFDHHSSGSKNCSADMTYFSLINSRKKNCPFEIADRASTLIGSDFDAKGFTSGDEDNIDFQSDTVFDSWRSGTTGTTNSSNPPLECMFIDSLSIVDDQPSSKKLCDHTNTNHETGPKKQLKPPDQDRSVASLVKYDRSLPSSKRNILPATRKNVILCHEAFALSTSSFLSLISNDYDDDNDDENDHENLTKDHNHLDPSTKCCHSCSSTFATRNLQHSPKSVLSNGSSEDHRRYLYRPHKPKTNVFDWSEPSSLEKLDSGGNPLRPKTAHVKDSPDNRTGRGLGRRYPCTFHIRSQSVPISPDMNACKIVSKFGTWGLGSTAISEDWDGDFDFDNIETENLSGEATLEGHHRMLVPEAIQASQENVTGHVGQIREVCLLVEDLKKLRVFGKEQGLLDGEFKPLWLQAEGIIALAAPMDDAEDVENIVVQKQKCECSSQICNGLPPYVSSNPPQPSCEDYKLNSEPRLCQHNLDSGLYEILDPIEPNDIPHANSSGPVVRDSDSSHRSNSISSYVLTQNSTEVARKLMESIHQQRSSSDPLSQSFTENSTSKMPFDTTSLKDLVNRASALSRALGQIVHAPDVSFLSSATRVRESSPAFTQVFLDPGIISPHSSPESTGYQTCTNSSIKNSPFQSSSQQMLMSAIT